MNKTNKQLKQETVSLLMNIMAEKNCSLLEAQLAANRAFRDQTDEAAKAIRKAFELNGSLTKESRIGV